MLRGGAISLSYAPAMAGGTLHKPSPASSPPAPTGRDAPLDLATPTSAPAWTRRDIWCVLGLLGLGLALRAVHFSAIAPTAFIEFPLHATQTDMYAVWEWSGEILAGDWLGRDTYHPDFEWMRRLGDRDDWTRWWGGWQIFQQEPMYPYMIAVLRGIGLPLAGVILAQLVIGAFQGVTVYLPAREMGGRAAGVIAGVLATSYAPLIFNQGALLRDWLLPLLMPVVVWAMVWAHRRSAVFWPWLAIGAGMGVLLWTRAFSLLFLPVLIAWAAWPREGRRVTWIPAAGTILGVASGFAPLAIRNLLVGAPPLAIHNRTTEAILFPNLAEGRPIGLRLPESPELLEAAEGSTLKALWLVGQSHEWSPISMLTLALRKCRLLIDPAEIPNNISFAYGCELSPWLAWLPAFGLLLPCALGGAAALLLTRRSVAVRRCDLLLITAWLGVGTLAILATTVLGRYRLELVPALCIIAGLGFAQCLACWPRLPRTKLVVIPVIIVATVVLQRHVIAIQPYGGTYRHGLSYRVSARIYDERGKDGAAAREWVGYLRILEMRGAARRERMWVAAEVVRLGLQDIVGRANTGQTVNRLASTLEPALSVYQTYQPDVPGAPYVLGRVLLGTSRREKGRALLEQYVRQSPDGRYADSARRLLREVPPSVPAQR